MISGATRAASSTRNHLLAWVINHRNVGVETLLALFRNWITSLMTWLVLGIAMALPVFLYLVLANVTALSGNFDGKPRISFYLHQDLMEADIQRFLTTIGKHRDIDSIKYTSPEQALADFQSRSGFGDVLSSLDRNPLPGVVELTLSHTDSAKLRVQIGELEQQPQVDMVVVDMAWIERLFAFITFGERLVVALTMVLALGVLLAVGNTIRLAIENKRVEIEVIKLVGGTDSFVRRPFLYLGLWYGFGGALVSWCLVLICLVFLSGPVELIAQSYRDNYALSGLNASETIVLLCIGSVLGILGASLAISKHLHAVNSSG